MAEQRWRILSAFAAVYLIWGSTYLAIRFAIETLPPFLMSGVRFVLAGALLWGWAALRGKGRPTRADFKGAAILGAFLLLGGNGGVMWAQMHGMPSGLTALLVSTVPLWVVLLEWLSPRSLNPGRPARPVILGVLGGLVGVMLLVGPANLSGEGVFFWGAMALMAGSLSWAYGSTLARRLEQPSSPTLGTALQMVAGGMFLLIAGVVYGEVPGIDLEAVTLKSTISFGYLVVVGSVVAFSAYVFLIKEVPVAKVSTYAYVNPVVALVLGWLLAGEELATRTLVAAAVILVSVVLITTYRQPGRPLLRRGLRRRRAPLHSIGHGCALDESDSSGEAARSSRRTA